MDINYLLIYFIRPNPIGRPNPITTSSRCRLGTTTWREKPTVMVSDVRRSDAPVTATSVATPKMALGIRAFPSCDAHRHRSSDATRIQGLPSRGRRGLKNNIVRLRSGTLNIGTLTGISREMSDALKRRRIDFVRVQEVKWTANMSSSKNLGRAPLRKMPEAGLKIAQKRLKNTFFVKILPKHLIWLGSG